jgi:hypothetical protein
MLPVFKMRVTQSAFRYGVICVGYLFAWAIWSSANSIIVPKLESLPGAHEVVAFANWTYHGPNYLPDLSNLANTPPVERYHLEESCLKRFLQLGRLEKSSTDESKYGRTQLKDLALPLGIFFTSKHEVFYWRMWNEHFLDVWDRDGRRATVSLADGCPPVAEYPTNKLLTVPKRADVVAIISTNNINYDRAPFQDSFHQKFREEARRNKHDLDVSPPPPPKVDDETLFKFLELGIPQASGYRPLPFGSFGRANGGLVLRDRRILYFELWEPKLLFMEAEDGAACVIRLN